MLFFDENNIIHGNMIGAQHSHKRGLVVKDPKFAHMTMGVGGLHPSEVQSQVIRTFLEDPSEF